MITNNGLNTYLLSICVADWNPVVSSIMLFHVHIQYDEYYFWDQMSVA